MAKGVKRPDEILEALKAIDFAKRAAMRLKNALKEYEEGDKATMQELKEALREFDDKLEFFDPYKEELERFLEAS